MPLCHAEIKQVLDEFFRWRHAMSLPRGLVETRRKSPTTAHLIVGLQGIVEANLLLDLEFDPHSVHVAIARRYWTSPVLNPEYEIDMTERS
jgi:hypothetical protein